MIKRHLFVLFLQLLVLSAPVQGLERDSLLINLTHIKSDYLHVEDTTASIVYGGDDERVKMSVTNGSGTLLTRYYAGERYEKDIFPGNVTKERLYLGGDTYSAPMVYVRTGSGNWELYNIGRDYLGSIVQIQTSGGSDEAYASYDPWGNEYVYTDSPLEFLGRGFTGHEHLPWFGLINMNARLYDPLTGRFLAPDPYVQDPGFTQNYNRYTYGLNNPLKYTDPEGEFAWTTLLLTSGITAAIFGAGNLAAHAIRGDDFGHSNWLMYFGQGALAGAIVGATAYLGLQGMIKMSVSSNNIISTLGYIGIYGSQGLAALHVVSTIAGEIGSAISHKEQGLANWGKIILGNFYIDENKGFFGGLWEGVSRHTWEFLQTGLGYDYTMFRRMAGVVDRVDFWGGATFATNESYEKHQGITLGNYINASVTESISVYSSTFDDYIRNEDQLYAHEYGHTIQSRHFGFAYPIIGVLSFGSAISDYILKTGHDHDYYFTEVMANRFSEPLFPGYRWGSSEYPTEYCL